MCIKGSSAKWQLRFFFIKKKKQKFKKKLNGSSALLLARDGAKIGSIHSLAFI